MLAVTPASKNGSLWFGVINDADSPVGIDIPELSSLLNKRDAAASVIPELRKRTSPIEQEGLWDTCGQHFHGQARYHEALSIYYALYEAQSALQQAQGKRAHKGTALVRIADAHAALHHPLLAKRYMMLTACEDAIRDRGIIPAETTGTYFRLVWYYGISDEALRRYAAEIWNRANTNNEEARFPETILQELDQEWMTEYPSPEEATVYTVNTVYIRWLLSKLGSGDGTALERLAHYLLSCLPGFRASLLSGETPIVSVHAS